MFNIPWPREFLSVHGLQMVAAPSRVVNDPVRPFLGGAELPLYGIFGCRGNFAQDEISYVQLSEFYPFIVVVSHPLLVLCYSDGRFFSHFVQAIQIDLQVVVVAFFVERLSLGAGSSHLYLNHGFYAIRESEGSLSRRCSCRGSVSPEGVR